MKIPSTESPRRSSPSGMSLVEMLVAMALGSVVLSSAAMLFIYSLFSFAGLGNYAILTGQSRLSLDMMSREMRESTGVLSSTSSGQVKEITLTNAYAATASRFSWDSTTGILTWEKTGEPTRTCLTGCDQWNFTFYQRTPTHNWTFYPTTDLDTCKLINMDWKSSRSILGKKINTETVVTAQVVLRNKP
jgi:prepilin-type N-terminal cleavage/methylation domain-containing protein